MKDLKHDYHRAQLPPRQRALCEFAERLTRTPSLMRADDLEVLRRHDLTDRDILDTVQVIAYFNYINRVADALGVDPEPEMQEALARWNRESRRPSEL